MPYTDTRKVFFKTTVSADGADGQVGVADGAADADSSEVEEKPMVEETAEQVGGCGLGLGVRVRTRGAG